MIGGGAIGGRGEGAGSAAASLAHLCQLVSRSNYSDLLTGRTVGSLKLYSLFADADHFIIANRRCAFTFHR
jgi:hypothetical protein